MLNRGQAQVSRPCVSLAAMPLAHLPPVGARETPVPLKTLAASKTCACLPPASSPFHPSEVGKNFHWGQASRSNLSNRDDPGTRPRCRDPLSPIGGSRAEGLRPALFTSSARRRAKMQDRGREFIFAALRRCRDDVTTRPRRGEGYPR